MPWSTVKHTFLLPETYRPACSIACDRQHLHFHIQRGLAHYDPRRPNQSLTKPIGGSSKRGYRTPVMIAHPVRKRWLVRDLLQLPVPDGY